MHDMAMKTPVPQRQQPATRDGTRICRVLRHVMRKSNSSTTFAKAYANCKRARHYSIPGSDSKNCVCNLIMDPTPVRHTKSFDNGLKKLARKHPTVFDAVDLLIDEPSHGQRPGIAVPPRRRIGVFRVRLANRSARSGKSGGFRVAYHISDAGHGQFARHLRQKRM